MIAHIFALFLALHGLIHFIGVAKAFRLADLPHSQRPGARRQRSRDDARGNRDAVDDRTARAVFTNGGHTVRAELRFDANGDLADFVSDDRGRLGGDGATMLASRWRTPLTGHRRFGAVRTAGGGEARWQDGGSDFAYAEMTIDAIEDNLSSR